MTKNRLILMSIVAAIPAAILSFLIIFAFLADAENMPGMLYVINGLTLLLSAFVTVLPVGIMLFVGREKLPADVASQPSDEDVDESLNDEPAATTDD